MATLNVYEQYFAASAVFNGIERRGVRVMLISTSENGEIRYEVAVTFFPHTSPEDYAVSYDAYYEKELYQAKGRRSKKREEELLEHFPEVIDELAEAVNGTVFWEKPLREARRG